jgi:hypothetical protein
MAIYTQFGSEVELLDPSSMFIEDAHRGLVPVRRIDDGVLLWAHPASLKADTVDEARRIATKAERSANIG